MFDLQLIEKNNGSVFLVENCLSPRELLSLDSTFNSVKNKLLSPEETGTARKNGIPIKKNLGYWLHRDPQPPIVYNLEKKLFRSIAENKESYRQDSVYANCLYSNISTHLLSYYIVDGDEYKAHIDHSIITFVGWFHGDDKNFTGGDLYFPELDITVECKNNTGVIFPSNLFHQVDPIKIIDKNIDKGRLSYSIFCSHNTTT